MNDKDSKELKNNFSESLSVTQMLKFYGRATRYIMAEFFSGRRIQDVSRMTLQQQQKNTMPFPKRTPPRDDFVGFYVLGVKQE